MRSNTPTPAELLDEVEPLSHVRRCRRLAGYARERAGRPEPAELLAGLARLGQYERVLAVLLATAARDLGHLTRAMSDPDPEVARYATLHAMRLGAPDDAVAEIVRTAPAQQRRVVYHAIRRTGRRELAERLIDEVRARWGDEEAAGLLPACGAGAVAARLAALGHAVPNWKSLAKRHPMVVLGHVETVLAESPRYLRRGWWQAFAPGVEVIAGQAPERVIALLERFWTPAVRRCAGLLLDADPARTLALYLAPGRQAELRTLLRRRSVRRRLAALTDARLGEVGRAVRDDEQAVADLLLAVPPGRRDALFTEVMRGADLSRAIHSERLLNVLPLRRRVAEARRMLGLRAVAESPRRTLEVTAFLPYDEAEPVLRAATRRSDALDRAHGYRQLIACAGRSRDPAVLTRLTGALGRLRNEQDPVRQAAVEALAGLPTRLFRAGHAPFLDRLAEDATAARDCSHSTRYRLARLAARVFEQGARQDDAALLECALRTFERLADHTGTVSLGPLTHVLRRGQEAGLVRRLAPYLEAEADLDRHRLAFLLADALDRRGHDLPELQRALERGLGAVRDDDAVRAIELWLGPSRTRDERVARLLESDPSVVTVPAVFGVLAWERTDLLDVVLGSREPVGRFAKGGVRKVPRAGREAVRRWTPRQRAAYARLLEGAARNGGLPAYERALAVRELGEVPGIEAERLWPYLDRDEALLRRAALTALPWTARPQDVLADLLSYASGDDAHVAVYAAARAAGFVRPDELVAALEPVLAGGKVTARKEAVRLLARHRAPGAMARLRSLWEQEGQHKDVRVAVAASMPALLGEPAAWELLREAVAEGGDVAAPVLRKSPLDVPEGARAAYGELVVAATRAGDRETRQAAVRALPHWVAYAPRAVSRLAEIVCDLGESATWGDAALGLVEGAGSGFGRAELRRVVDVLAAAPGEPDAGRERDRPAAQRLAGVVLALRETHGQEPEAMAALVPEVAGRLPGDLAAELLAATVDWRSPREVLARLARSVPGVLAAVEAGRLLAESAEETPAEHVLPHARWLAGEGETGALLATALAASCGPRSGWAEPWRELLRRVRTSGFPEAAHQALRVRTAEE
ncbi:hypothetical protein [Nonomuraea candida]|uniref:hypothetical protein n=1 Tax=Nonomuraea candida TaxID=359159 RepID=UPI0005B78F81|nr:hypothetical protein [Nonomuraea candida]